jgi:hypothetical protein
MVDCAEYYNGCIVLISHGGTHALRNRRVMVRHIRSQRVRSNNRMQTEHTVELTQSDLDFMLRCAAKLAIELVQAGVTPDEAQDAAAGILIRSLGLFQQRERVTRARERVTSDDVPEAFKRFIASLGDD